MKLKEMKLLNFYRENIYFLVGIMISGISGGKVQKQAKSIDGGRT